MRRMVAAVAAMMLLAGCAGPTDAPTPQESDSPTTQVPSSTVPTAPSPTATEPTTPATQTSAPAPTPPPSSPEEKKVELAITLKDGSAEPNGERLEVAVGTTVVITVTSDRKDEIHVHGFDLEIPVSPGKTATREFVADQTGSFEIESHEPELLIVQLQVR